MNKNNAPTLLILDDCIHTQLVLRAEHAVVLVADGKTKGEPDRKSRQRFCLHIPAAPFSQFECARIIHLNTEQNIILIQRIMNSEQLNAEGKRLIR